MATRTRRRRRHRSAAQRAATRRMLAARRAQLRGVKVRVRTARRARRRGRSRRRARARTVTVAVSNPPRRRRSRSRVRHHRRSRRSSRGRSRGRHRARRHRPRQLYRRSRRGRMVRANPGGFSFKAIVRSYTGGITGVMGNMRAVTRNGWKGYAAGAAGAVASIFAGTLLARVTMPLAMKAFPSVAASATGARVLAFANYYTGGWAVAHFTPGLKPQTRDALLFGTVVASVVEVIRPGTIQALVAKIPGVGESIAGHLSGIESELSDYVQQALAGLGHAGYEYDGSQGFHDYQQGAAALPVGALSGKPPWARGLGRLSDYEVAGGRLNGLADASDGTDMGSAAATAGSGSWDAMRSDHDLSKLSCPMVDDGAMTGA